LASNWQGPLKRSLMSTEELHSETDPTAADAGADDIALRVTMRLNGRQ
jgi:hypothetical protein